jgi:hypothetical protein
MQPLSRAGGRSDALADEVTGLAAAGWGSGGRRPGLGQLEEASRQVREVVLECRVVEVHDERVHDGAADGGRQHRRRYPGRGVGILADQDREEVRSVCYKENGVSSSFVAGSRDAPISI